VSNGSLPRGRQRRSKERRWLSWVVKSWELNNLTYRHHFDLVSILPQGHTRVYVLPVLQYSRHRQRPYLAKASCEISCISRRTVEGAQLPRSQGLSVARSGFEHSPHHRPEIAVIALAVLRPYGARLELASCGVVPLDQNQVLYYIPLINHKHDKRRKS
jgi:hypothetical protein